MEEIDIRHIHVLEFPKQLLWTDRDLEYFLEEMSSEECRMNNNLYDAFLGEVKVGQAYSPEDALNLAYYECVRISLARYPESKDIFDVLEMDIQHNQSQVNYGFTDLVMNMVWAMLYSTDSAKRFTDKLHSYLINSKKLRYSFRRFFTPNDSVHNIYPYEEEEEPHYDIKFTPCPDEAKRDYHFGDWCKLTIGYKENLIDELLMLWPEEDRDYIRQCIMNEKAAQTKNFEEFAKKHVSEFFDEPELDFDTNVEDSPANDSSAPANSELQRECDEWKAKCDEYEKILQARTDEVDKWHCLYEEETKRTVMVSSLEEELERWKKKCEELERRIEPEKAFNAQTGMPCFTSRQMGILLTAIGRITEKDNPPGKTTLGEIVEKIGGYKATTASSNMRGAMPEGDINAVATTIEDKFPNLAAEVRKV